MEAAVVQSETNRQILLYWGSIGVIEKKMETTIMGYRVNLVSSVRSVCNRSVNN